jgi:hypothetical protein
MHVVVLVAGGFGAQSGKVYQITGAVCTLCANSPHVLCRIVDPRSEIEIRLHSCVLDIFPRLESGVNC